MIRDLTTNTQQKEALENCISDLYAEFVELTHLQDEGDCLKAFFTLEGRNGKNRHDSIYFTCHMSETTVTDFAEKTFH